MKIQRTTEMLHPILKECTDKIQKIIIKHNIPIRLFETGRTHDRHQLLLQKGKTKDIVSKHLYNLQNEPILYAVAVDYVYYHGRWSWNLRNSTTISWYTLFGNLVLDKCPVLKWSGTNRKNINYCHFELKQNVIIDNQKDFPCILH